MADQKKKIISLRLNNSDLSKIKEIAKRLDVRESEVMRFAIKSTLGRLAPLHDPSVRGSDLIPALTEFGPELANYFDLDAGQMETVINSDSGSTGNRVDQSDIQLMVLAGMQERYVYLKLKDIVRGDGGSQGPQSLLREYLLAKYVTGAEGVPGKEIATN